MSSMEEMERQLLMARGIGLGLAAVLTSLIGEHAKLIGGDRNEALAKTRLVLDDSLKQLAARGTTAGGEKMDVSPDMQRRVGILINQAEQSARRLLGLPSGSRSAH
jgi:hypothetical protein